MAYLSVPKIFRHLTFLRLSSPFLVDSCSHISNLSFAITYFYENLFEKAFCKMFVPLLGNGFSNKFWEQYTEK